MGTKRETGKLIRKIQEEAKSRRRRRRNCKRGVKISDTFKTIFVDKHLYNVRRKGEGGKERKKKKSLSRIIAHKR